MPAVVFTSHLQRFFPDLQKNLQLEGGTVAEILSSLDQRYPGFADYFLDERGKLRKHVNIFIDDTLITDRDTLQDPVAAGQRVFFMQALSGG